MTSAERAGGGGAGGRARARAAKVGAGQVEQRGGAAAAAGHAEAGAGTGVGEGVPPGVGVAEQGASDLVPVRLGVGERRNGVTLGGAADGPAGLGHPDLLARSDGLGLLEGVVEQGLGVVDAVGHAVLEVRVAVETEPVDRVDHRRVGAVSPGVPGVDVTDRGTAEGGTRDRRADLIDVVDHVLGADTGTGAGLGALHRVTVKVLAADGDTDNQLAEGLAVGVDRRLESIDLVVDVSTRGPQAEQK